MKVKNLGCEGWQDGVAVLARIARSARIKPWICDPEP